MGGRTVADDGRPPAVVVVAAAAALRGVKDAASGFRAGRLVPVAGVAGWIMMSQRTDVEILMYGLPYLVGQHPSPPDLSYPALRVHLPPCSRSLKLCESTCRSTSYELAHLCVQNWSPLPLS